jgi:streptogramin lyase
VRRRPGWRQVLAPGIALVAGAATVGVTAALLSAGDGGSQPSGTADAPAAPVRGSARVAQNVDVDPRPNSLAYAQGRIWVTSPGNGRLIGLDAQGNRPRRTIKLPWSAGSRSVTAGFGSLWVTNGLDSILARIDPTSGAVRARIQLPRGEPVAAAAGGGSVWIARRGTPGTAPDSVLKIDPSADKVVTELVFGEEGVNNLAVGDGGVYVTNRRRDRLSRIDVRTGVRRSVPIGRQPRGVDVGGGFVWVANFDAGTATQLTPGLRNPYDVISGSGPAGVAVGRDTVWVTNQLDGTVARLDLRTGEQVGAPIPVGRNPYAIVARGASAWVTRLADAKVTRIDAG